MSAMRAITHRTFGNRLDRYPITLSMNPTISGKATSSPTATIKLTKTMVAMVLGFGKTPPTPFDIFRMNERHE